MTKTNKILNYIYILIGLFIFIYYIYIRIIITRVPKDLQFNFFDENYFFKMILLIFSITTCSFIIITSVMAELNLTKKENSLTKFFKIFGNIIKESLGHFYAFIMSFFTNSFQIVFTVCNNFYNIFNTYSETTFLFFIFLIRIIILLTFLIDVFYFFKFNYFYKALILICIILLIKILIYVLRDFTSNLETLKEALIIHEESFDNKTQLPIISYQLKPEYEDNDLCTIIEQYILCNKLSGYLNFYDRYNHFFTFKFNIIIYSCYLSGWLYIFFHNIYI